MYAKRVNGVGVSEEETKVETALELALKRVLVDRTASPRAAHHLRWTRVGLEYVLEVGHYDLVALREAMNKAKEGESPVSVDFYVTDRFTLGLDTIERITDSMKELRDDWDKLMERLAQQKLPGEEQSSE